MRIFRYILILEALFCMHCVSETYVTLEIYSEGSDFSTNISSVIWHSTLQVENRKQYEDFFEEEIETLFFPPFSVVLGSSTNFHIGTARCDVTSKILSPSNIYITVCVDDVQGQVYAVENAQVSMNSSTQRITLAVAGSSMLGKKERAQKKLTGPAKNPGIEGDDR